MSEPIWYLTIDQILALHDLALKQFGGVDGLRSPQQLASAVMQPQQSAFGEDAYPTIPEKAAAYGYFIAEAQAFIDGNKRTAAAALETFLAINSFEFLQEDDEIATMFEGLGAKTIGQGAFVEWVCTHARPRSGGADVVPYPSTDTPS